MQLQKRLSNSGHETKNTLVGYAYYLLPTLCVAYFTYLALGLELDDALIYLRYVRNFHAGAGLIYNPAENFNGLSSPLYTAALILGGLLSNNLQLVMILLSGAFFLAAALLGASLFAKSRVELAVTATVIGCTGYFYSTFGMETGLFLLLIAASLSLYRKESLWFLIALSLLVITRAEGVFLALVLALDYLYRHRQLPDWRYLLAALTLASLPFIFNWFYYGALLPATGSAKIAQGKSGLWGEDWIFLNVAYLKDTFFSGSVFAPLFLLLTALGALGALHKQRCVWLSLLFLVLLLSFYLGFNIPNYHWYYAPFFYFLILFACRGIWLLGVFALAQSARSWRGAALGVVLIGALLTLAQLISLETRGADQHYVDMGNWIKKNTPKDASVAMVEIGTVGWHSQRPIIDILGLVSPYNARHIGEREFLHWLLHYQPDYILRHEPAWAHEQSIPPLEEQGLYAAKDDVAISGLVLLERKRTQDTVRQFADAAIRESRPFKEMVRNSDIGAPAIVLEDEALFAHAPSSLRLTLPEPVSSIQLGFGIKEGAQGLHGRLCFAVRRESDNADLLERCIEARAEREAMHQELEIREPLKAGDALLFDTRCVQTCNYAWTYWSHVLLEEI